MDDRRTGEAVRIAGDLARVQCHAQADLLFSGVSTVPAGGRGCGSGDQGSCSPQRIIDPARQGRGVLQASGAGGRFGELGAGVEPVPFLGDPAG